MRSLPHGATEWLAAQSVVPSTVRRLRATTADLFAIDDLVFRWYRTSPFLEVEPDALSREVAALTALADGVVPAPRLVAWTVDPPAVLMTRLPGEHRRDASGADGVSRLLDQIHAVPPGTLAAWSYRGYHENVSMPRPSWWRGAALWELALARSRARTAGSGDHVVIHRDFHPGNLLWSGDAVSGIVDWGNACIGPAAFDLAHYRVNIATLIGPEIADREFPGDPVWDIEAALGYLDPKDVEWTGPWPHVGPERARSRLEQFVARAVAALG